MLSHPMTSLGSRLTRVEQNQAKIPNALFGCKELNSELNWQWKTK
jgi:hypothetical protein